MKWMVELENGERIEVEYLEFQEEVVDVELGEDEMAVRPYNSMYYTGILQFKSKEDKQKFKESGIYIIMPVNKVKTIEVVGE